MTIMTKLIWRTITGRNDNCDEPKINDDRISFSQSKEIISPSISNQLVIEENSSINIIGTGLHRIIHTIISYILHKFLRLLKHVTTKLLILSPNINRIENLSQSLFFFAFSFFCRSVSKNLANRNLISNTKK